MLKKFLLILLLPFLLHAKQKVIYKQIYPNIEPPWLTGPLLAPSAHVIPLGAINIEPYYYANAYTGKYDSDWNAVKKPIIWSHETQVSILFGIAPLVDFQLNPTVYWNYTQHESSWSLGDMLVAFDIQLYTSRERSYIPSVKLTLKETIPMGKYQNLNPKKLGIDAGGTGSWSSGAALVIGHLIHFKSVYYFNYRLTFAYVLPAPVRLKGFNHHGGGYGTDARFFPPQNIKVDLGLEFTLAQTWAFALDVVGFWAARTHYTGNPGMTAPGVPATLGHNSQAQFALAPAIEYNWNADLGVIAGVWFTVAGRNIVSFTTATAALNYYY